MIDHHTPLIRIPWHPDLDIRRAVVANALSIVNVQASDSTRPILEELLGPVRGRWDLDRPFRCWQENGKWKTQGISTCGLVAEGLWRRVQVDAPWLWQDYVSGKAIERAVTFAKQCEAWVRPGDGRVPRPGEYVVIGSGLGTHALTCIDWEGDTLVSVDGGQVGARGLQAIHVCRRPWKDDALGARRIVGWVDPEMLRYRVGEMVVVPEGWESACDRS